MVLPGRVAAALALPARPVVEPGPVPDAPPPARRRALRAGRAAGLRRVLRGAPRVRRQSVRDGRARAVRRGRAEPAAALPGDDDPPADALLGVHAVRGALRVCGRRARGAPGRCRVDHGHAPLRPRRVVLPRRGHHPRRPLVLRRARLGGYWAWDPVENASLLPWLTGTAFIHSVMIQEKRGMLK